MRYESSGEALEHLRVRTARTAAAAAAVASAEVDGARMKLRMLETSLDEQNRSLRDQLASGVSAEETERYARTVADLSAQLAFGQEHLDVLEMELFSRRASAADAVRQHQAVAKLIARRRAGRRRRALARQGAIVDVLNVDRWHRGGEQ